jgi:hypothetical protein
MKSGFDKWTRLQHWLADEHRSVIHKQRIAIRNRVAVQIKDDQDIIDVLEKMRELDMEERKWFQDQAAERRANDLAKR